MRETTGPAHLLEPGQQAVSRHGIDLVVCVRQVEPCDRSGPTSWSDHRNRVRTGRKLREGAHAPARVDCDDRCVGGARVRPKKGPSRHGAEATRGDRDFVTSARTGVVADEPDVAGCADRVDGAAGRFRMAGAAGGGHEPVAETADRVEHDRAVGLRRVRERRKD